MRVITTKNSKVKPGLEGEAEFSHTARVMPDSKWQDVYFYRVTINGHVWENMQLGRDFQPLEASLQDPRGLIDDEALPNHPAQAGVMEALIKGQL